MKPGDLYRIKILKLVSKGKGLAHLDNQVVFIPYVLPEEEVEIEITQVKKDYLLGKKHSVITPSPFRIIPVCPVFEQCGGCHWQMMDYSHQIRIKSGLLKETLHRIGKIDPDILPVFSSTRPLQYRQRVKLQTSFVKGQIVIGFYRLESKNIVPIHQCFIIDSRLNTLLAEILPLINRTPSLFRTLKEISLSLSSFNHDLLIALRMEENSVPDTVIEDFFKLPDHIKGIVINLPGHIQKVFGQKYIYNFIENPLNPAERLRIRNSAEVFSQINREMNLKLIEILLQWTQLTGKERILELYCGNGNFTLLLARYSFHMTAVEENPFAVDDLRYNLQINRVKNCAVRNEKSQTVLLRWDQSRFPLDLMILDPPREGIDRSSLESILRIKPSRIYYISCDPATLARDLKALSKNYTINRIAPFDMFPQTAHLETLTELYLSNVDGLVKSRHSRESGNPEGS